MRSIIDDIWPTLGSLPITKEEFLIAAANRPASRMVAGPNNSFSAVRFDRAWGVRFTNQVRLAAGRSAVRSNTPMASGTGPVSRVASLLLKGSAMLATLGFVASAVFAIAQYWEIERLQAEVKNQADTKIDAEIDAEQRAGQLKKEIDKANNASERKTTEIASLTRRLAQLRDENERLNARNDELESLHAASPEKVDQAELLELRRFRSAADTFMEEQSKSLRKLQANMPEPRMLDTIKDYSRSEQREKE